MSVLPLRRAVVGLVFALGFLLIQAISRADTAADALGKWWRDTRPEGRGEHRRQ